MSSDNQIPAVSASNLGNVGGMSAFSSLVTSTPVLGKRSDHRRHSLRSIKRRKFDDEIVESSLASKAIRRSLDGSTPSDEMLDSVVSPGSGTVPTSPLNLSTVPESHTDLVKSDDIVSSTHLPTSTALDKKVLSVSSEKKIQQLHRRKKLKKTRQAFAAVKDMGRWRATDDILLIDAVEQVGDLTSVHLAVKFSCYFTLEEVQERWYALLYDPVISGLARQAMKTLSREVVKVTHAKALFSKSEEDILRELPSFNEPTLLHLRSLISENPMTFHPDRTAESLLRHWSLMRQYTLLSDQTIQPLPKGDHILNFSDAEDLLDDNALSGLRDHVLNGELSLADRRQKREIKQLEEESERWKVLVSTVSCSQPASQFDEQTVGVLQGRLVRYLMRSKEITLGRCASDVVVDVDLSLEGPAFKISRKQGVIKLKKNGEFIISNIGKRPIFVDNKPVPTGCKCRLCHNSVVELGLLRFVFVINRELVKAMTTSNKPAGK